MTSTVRVESELPTSADEAWVAIQRPYTAGYVLRGVIGLPALSRRTGPIRAGQSGTGWLFLFHVIPLSRHTITVVDVDHESRTLRSTERGGIIRAWRHALHAEPISADSCRYTDTVEVDAGRLTPLVAGFARALFRYRHRRWRRLLRLAGQARATAGQSG